jgi:hypothetical protein
VGAEEKREGPLQQRRRFRRTAPRPSAWGSAELLPILPHDRGGRLQPNAATLVDKGTFGGYSPDNVLGSEYRRHLAAILRTNSCKQSKLSC